MKSLAGLPWLSIVVSCVPGFFAFTVPLQHRNNVRSNICSVAASSLEECDLDEAGASDCLSLSGYTPKTSSYVTVSEVYVAEIETLRDRFDSYDDESDKNNIIKFNKRRKRGTHAFANTTTSAFSSSSNGDYQEPAQSRLLADNTHVANLEYTEIVGDDEIVLIDTVRKPGMQSISRAFPRAGPRKSLHFNPSEVNAAIVTCGGLCPGKCKMDLSCTRLCGMMDECTTVWFAAPKKHRLIYSNIC